ncbi:hypothetical protein D9M70_464430 [compost metagenome]
MLVAGAVGGVDGAVEQLDPARVFSRGEQLAVVHAAQLPVPFAVALEAHVHRIKFLRALEAGARAHGIGLGIADRGARGQRDAVAQFFAGELAIEVELAGDLLEVLLRLGIAAFGLERAAIPVEPRRVLGAQFGAHQLHRLAHRELADHAPGRALLVARQRALGGTQVGDGLVGVGARHLDDGGERVAVDAGIGQQRGDLAGQREVVLLQRQPRLEGSIAALDLLALHQVADQVDAAFAVIARIAQRLARLGGNVLALERARQQRIAFDLGVVLERELRVLGIEVGPVALLAQHQQPVVAHAVGDGLALVALQEGAHLVVGRVGARQAAGVEHLRLDAEVFDVRRDRVVDQGGRDRVGALHVILARRFAQRGEGLVGIARDHRRLLLAHGRLRALLRMDRRDKQCTCHGDPGGPPCTLQIYSLQHSLLPCR